MAVTVTDNNDGTLTIDGATITDNEDGTLDIEDASVVDNGDGTLYISDPNSGGGGYTPGLLGDDAIMEDLIANGYITGTKLDRERTRLLEKNNLTDTTGANFTLQDLYFLADERPRIY